MLNKDGKHEMSSNIINHKHVAELPLHETKLFIRSKNIPAFEEFQTILEKYGYNLKDDLYMVIQFIITMDAQILPLVQLIKALQSHISNHTTCMFDFSVTRQKNCMTKIVFK